MVFLALLYGHAWVLLQPCLLGWLVLHHTIGVRCWSFSNQKILPTKESQDQQVDDGGVVEFFFAHLMVYQSPAFGRGLTIVAMKKNYFLTKVLFTLP